MLDIGAGTGAITAHLVAKGARVIAFELHPRRAHELRVRFATANVKVVQTDAADLRLPGRPFRVVANPPFAITTAVLRRLLAPNAQLARADLIVPRGVAMRWVKEHEPRSRPRDAYLRRGGDGTCSSFGFPPAGARRRRPTHHRPPVRHPLTSQSCRRPSPSRSTVPTDADDLVDATGGHGMDQLGELGFYTLAGHSATPRDLVSEVIDAERLGLGSAFVSERFNTKEAATLCGAAAAVSDSIGIATAATNHNTRHPLVTATFGVTMHRMTGGRFAMGFGRGFDALFDVIGLPHVTMAQLADEIDLLGRLWHGETIFGHDGPAGRYPMLFMDPAFDEDIPILLVALGEKTLEFAGRVADAVVLHTFFTDDTLARSVAAVRRGAELAGRDPAEVRVWSVLATVGDHLDEQLRLRKLVGRLATYLQGYGDLLVSVNGWDPEVLVRFRQDELVSTFSGAFDASADTAQLEHLAELLPDEWLAASATGSAERCASRVVDQFGAGADGVILHGATPAELEPVLGAYRSVRPPAIAARATANPARFA